MATISEQRTIEPAIMASEIERLPDLEGFLKFASIPDWKRVRLAPVSYPMVERRRGRKRRNSDAPAAEAVAVRGIPDYKVGSSDQGTHRSLP